MSDESVINERILEQRKGIKWNATVFMALFHVGAVAALFMFSWRALLVSILLWWISASLGVGMGFHRLLTHRAYKTPKLVEYFLTLCGTLTLEGGPIYWVVTHRIHHAHTDAMGYDPVDRAPFKCERSAQGQKVFHQLWRLVGTMSQESVKTHSHA